MKKNRHYPKLNLATLSASMKLRAASAVLAALSLAFPLLALSADQGIPMSDFEPKVRAVSDVPLPAASAASAAATSSRPPPDAGGNDFGFIVPTQRQDDGSGAADERPATGQIDLRGF